MVKILTSVVFLQALCSCTSNRNFEDDGGCFERVSGPSLSLKNAAKFFEMVFQDVTANREVRLVVEYEDLPGQPLTDFDLMREIQIFEDGNIMSHRTIFDPWGPREQRDGGLLGDLIPDQTRLKSKSIGNYQFIFTESGIGTTPDREYSVRFERGKLAGFERYEPGTR